MTDKAKQLEALLPRLLRRMFSEAESDALAELSLAQMRILRALLEAPHTSGEVVGLLGLSQSALSQLTQRLVAAGLVRKSKDPHDARIKHLELTDKGRALMEERRQARVEQAQRVLGQLDDAEQAELLRLLQKMSHAVSKESWINPIERLTA